MSKVKTFIKENYLTFITFIIIILLWEFLIKIFKVNQIIVPTPTNIFISITNNFSLLITNTWVTTFEAIVGFLIGFLLAFVFASIFVFSKNIKKAIYPYAIALKATPIYALGPVLVVWFGTGIWSKIVMSALVCFFPILVNLVKGFTAVEEDALNLFKTYGASKVQIFYKLRIKNSYSYLFPSLKIASTLAVIGATIGEFIGASKGIGYLIVNSSYYLNTSLMFAAIIFISVVGILFFYLIDYIEKKMVFWEIN